VEGGFKIAVFDLMGESLSDLFYRCGRRFSLKTVLMLAQQLISRLESVHEAGIVHRDVKPGNFVMGRGEEAGKVYVIDFGLSNSWLIGGKHIGFNMESPFRGTHRYASVNSHMKFEQSRRDDLEAVAYVLIYFLNGGLPWQSLKVSRSKRRKAIGKYKASISPESLCAGLPLQFTQFLTYVKMLGFDSTPDYQYCRNLFRSAFDEHGFEDDGVWDWDLLPAPTPAAAAAPATAAGTLPHPSPLAGQVGSHSAAPLNHTATPTPTFSISQTLAHYMQQQPPMAPALPASTAAHPIVPTVAHLPPIASTQLQNAPSGQRPLPTPHLRPSLIAHAAAQPQELNATSAQHRANGPCVNLASGLAPMPLPLNSRPSVSTLPKARINIMNNDFPSTFVSLNDETARHPAHRPHTVLHPSMPSSMSATHGFARVQHTKPHSPQETDTPADFLGLVHSHAPPARTAPATHHSPSIYASPTLAELDGSRAPQIRRTTRAGENAWNPLAAPHASSPLLGSTHEPLASFSGKARLTSSSSSGLQRSTSPAASPEPLTMDFMEEDLLFAHSNASLASLSTSAATSSAGSSVLSVSSSSTIASSPAHSMASHHHHHHHAVQGHMTGHQGQHMHQGGHNMSIPASPSSATHPDSPIPIPMSMDVAMDSDAILWSTSTPADMLAEASYISNATTTTECHSLCTSDTAAAVSCGTTTLALANEGPLSSSTSRSPSSSPNAKKRRRFAEPELLPEPICKRRSARLLDRELSSK
jgi:serine/threonine protein kinase